MSWEISIAQRLRPFSHLPGTSLVLPGSDYVIQIFPCLIRVYLNQVVMAELNLELKGPVHPFTICSDLEKGRISVSGKGADGWIRYHLLASKDGKGIRLLGDRFYLQQLDILPSSSPFEPFQVPFCERLSLGSNKAQDWEMIKRRLDLKEIFPHWHRLGQLVPSHSAEKVKLEEGDWLKIFLVGFDSLLVPQSEDQNHQGISFPLFPLLSEGAKLIRQLFVQQENKKISILPSLLPSFHAGRLLNVSLPEVGVISLEWTKKTIRRVILYSENEQEIELKFRSNVRSVRLREDSKDKGIIRPCSSSLIVKKGNYYFFDNFG